MRLAVARLVEADADMNALVVECACGTALYLLFSQRNGRAADGAVLVGYCCDECGGWNAVPQNVASNALDGKPDES